MSKKSILMMLAVFVVGIVAVMFLPKTVQAVDDTYDEYFYLCIDGVGGKVNGKDKILIKQKADEFTTVDLSKYKASVTVTNFADGDITNGGVAVKSLLP